MDYCSKKNVCWRSRQFGTSRMVPKCIWSEVEPTVGHSYPLATASFMFTVQYAADETNGK